MGSIIDFGQGDPRVATYARGDRGVGAWVLGLQNGRILAGGVGPRKGAYGACGRNDPRIAAPSSIAVDHRAAAVELKERVGKDARDAKGDEGRAGGAKKHRQWSGALDDISGDEHIGSGAHKGAGGNIDEPARRRGVHDREGRPIAARDARAICSRAGVGSSVNRTPAGEKRGGKGPENPPPAREACAVKGPRVGGEK